MLIPKMFLVIRLQSSAPVSMTWLVVCVALISVPRKGGELDFCITIADELALDRCFVACEGGKLHRGALQLRDAEAREALLTNNTPSIDTTSFTMGCKTSLRQ